MEGRGGAVCMCVCEIPFRVAYIIIRYSVLRVISYLRFDYQRARACEVQGTTLLCCRPYTHTNTHASTLTFKHTRRYIIIIMYACTKVITRFSLLPNSPDTIILRFVFRISVCQHALYIPQNGRYAFLVYYGKFKIHLHIYLSPQPNLL